MYQTIEQQRMTAKQIYELLPKIDDTEILMIISRKAREQREISASRVGWRVGQEVQLQAEFQHRRPYDTIGKITKVNPKKLQVKFDGIIWNIPKTMVKIV